MIWCIQEDMVIIELFWSNGVQKPKQISRIFISDLITLISSTTSLNVVTSLMINFEIRFRYRNHLRIAFSFIQEFAFSIVKVEILIFWQRSGS